MTDPKLKGRIISNTGPIIALMITGRLVILKDILMRFGEKTGFEAPPDPPHPGFTTSDCLPGMAVTIISLPFSYESNMARGIAQSLLPRLTGEGRWGHPLEGTLSRENIPPQQKTFIFCRVSYAKPVHAFLTSSLRPFFLVSVATHHH
jgi:hypothetical protein